MICLVSDTHENYPIILRALPMLKAFNPELVIHCGDIVSPLVLDKFSGLPMRFVFGNCDSEREALQRKADQLNFGRIGDDLELNVDGKSLYVYHGTRSGRLDQAIDSQVYDYVFHGHTHQRRNEKIGRTRVVNPGALFQASIYSFASLDLVNDTVLFHEIESDMG